MPGRELRMTIDVGVDPDSDAEELQDATLRLRRELLELEVDDVVQPSGGSPPPGARAADVALLGTLVVSAAQDVIGAVVRVVAGWLTRRPDRTVKLEIDGDSIELNDPSAEDQRRLIEAFLARHAAGSS